MQDNLGLNADNFLVSNPSPSEQMNELEQLYEQAPCGYHSLDKNGLFIRINQTELKMLGYSREEVIGKKKFSDLLTPQSQQTFQANFPKFKQQGRVSDLEFQMIRKDGSLLPVSLSATAICDEAGNYLMSRSVVIDISDRKRLETDLQNSESRYRLLFESNPNPMWIYDPQTLEFVELNEGRGQRAEGRRNNCRGIPTHQQLKTAKSKILAGALNPKSLKARRTTNLRIRLPFGKLRVTPSALCLLPSAFQGGSLGKPSCDLPLRLFAVRIFADDNRRYSTTNRLT